MLIGGDREKRQIWNEIDVLLPNEVDHRTQCHGYNRHCRGYLVSRVLFE